jgi:hypothetical protein
LLRATLLGLALFSPFLVGVSVRFGRRLSAGAIGATLVLLGALWVLSGSRSKWSHRLVLAVVSCFLSVTLLDTIARPLVNASRYLFKPGACAHSPYVVPLNRIWGT